MFIFLSGNRPLVYNCRVTHASTEVLFIFCIGQVLQRFYLFIAKTVISSYLVIFDSEGTGFSQQGNLSCVGISKHNRVSNCGQPAVIKRLFIWRQDSLGTRITSLAFPHDEEFYPMICGNFAQVNEGFSVRNVPSSIFYKLCKT